MSNRTPAVTARLRHRKRVTTVSSDPARWRTNISQRPGPGPEPSPEPSPEPGLGPPGPGPLAGPLRMPEGPAERESYWGVKIPTEASALPEIGLVSSGSDW